MAVHESWHKTRLKVLARTFGRNQGRHLPWSKWSDELSVWTRTWFPFRIQVYVNGHEWLARQLDRHQVHYTKVDNVFLRISNCKKAQQLSDCFERIDWVRVLDRYANLVNPLLGEAEVLHPMWYYWVTAQAEYMTTAIKLREVAYPNLFAAA